jgi:hypothetical protein
MQQTQEAKRKRKEEELAQDKKMLDAIRSSPPNRHLNIYGTGSPPPPPPGIVNQNSNASMNAIMGGGGNRLSLTMQPPAMTALGNMRGGTYEMYEDNGEGQISHTHLQENESAAGNRFVPAPVFFLSLLNNKLDVLIQTSTFKKIFRRAFIMCFCLSNKMTLFPQVGS